MFTLDDNISEYLAMEFHGNTVLEWLTALALLILLTVILVVIKRLLARRIERYISDTEYSVRSLIARMVRGTRLTVLFFAALYVSITLLSLPPRVSTAITTLAFIAALFQVGVYGNYCINNIISHYVSHRRKDAATVSGIAIISLFGRILVWSFILIVILDNLGVDVTTLIASLGVGGIAIGLATQNILGDLFASLSILLDKPFEEGHFIIVGDFLGTVEKIGLKTTRVRSLSGELLIFGNNDLLQSRIRNYRHFWERRVAFRFGVIYSTPQERLREIPDIVRQAVADAGRTRFDRAHFFEFGDSSLNFEVVYYVLDPDYNIYMDVQQAINLGIREALMARGIEFAFPTRTVHIAPGEKNADHNLQEAKG